MRIRCLACFFVILVTKLLISPVKIMIFCPKKSKFGPKMAFFSLWARPCQLIWLVVVVRGLYLARHLFTLSYKLSLFLNCLPCIQVRSRQRRTSRSTSQYDGRPCSTPSTWFSPRWTINSKSTSIPWCIWGKKIRGENNLYLKYIDDCLSLTFSDKKIDMN